MNDVLKSLIKQFMPFAQERIGFQKPPKLFLKHDEENAQNPLGKTAYYDPAELSVTLYVTDRHPKDVLRSLGHELVHHKQNCDGHFDEIGEGDMGEGYAQTNPHLRAMEIEANSKGSMALRDFEDRLKTENTIYYEHLQKGEKQMSIKDWKNGEISSLLSEAWGFKFNSLQEFDEFNGTGEIQEEAEEEESLEEIAPLAAAAGGAIAGKMMSGKRDKKKKKDDDEEESLEEIAPMVAAGAGMMAQSMMGKRDKKKKDVADVADTQDADDDESDEASERDEERDDAVDERRGRGRKGPHTRGAPDPRLREEKLRGAIREAIRLYKEKKTVKGKSKN